MCSKSYFAVNIKQTGSHPGGYELNYGTGIDIRAIFIQFHNFLFRNTKLEGLEEA